MLNASKRPLYAPEANHRGNPLINVGMVRSNAHKTWVEVGLSECINEPQMVSVLTNRKDLLVDKVAEIWQLDPFKFYSSIGQHLLAQGIHVTFP